MRLLLALLLSGAAANPLLSLASKAKSLVTAKSLVFCVVAAQNHASLHHVPTGSYGDLQEQPGQGQGHQGPGRGRVDRSWRRAATLQVRLLLAPPPRSTPA